MKRIYLLRICNDLKCIIILLHFLWELSNSEMISKLCGQLLSVELDYRSRQTMEYVTKILVYREVILRQTRAKLGYRDKLTVANYSTCFEY